MRPNGVSGAKRGFHGDTIVSAKESLYATELPLHSVSLVDFRFTYASRPSQLH